MTKVTAAATAARGYRAQLNREPAGAQAQPPAEEDAEGEAEWEAKEESSRSFSRDRHSGHSVSRSASCIRRSSSKRVPHFWQRYS